jgi:hypothetical protein
MKRLIWLGLVLGAAACGGSSSSVGTPTAPTAPSAVSAPAGAPASGATVQGTVTAPGASASARSSPASSSSAIQGLTVEVVGAGLSAPVDAAGRFTLVGVPAGTVRLRFFGPGVDVTVSLAGVGSTDTITIVVAVSPAGATIVSESRNGAPASPSVVEIEGRIEAVQPQEWIVVNGRRILVPAGTPMREGDRVRDWSDLKPGVRVHVKARVDGTDLIATFIEVQNTDVDLPVTLNGLVEGLSGTAAAFQFTVNGRLVRGDAATAFFGDGDRADSFASLANGRRVEVKGQQRDGFVYAVRIHVNRPDDDQGDDRGPQQESASIHGTLTEMGGSVPNLTLRVGGTVVRTSAATEVKRRGDRQGLEALRVGQSLHVVGDRRADGSLDARKIEIDDDAAGGEFEIEGALGGLSGTCPAVRFGVNGFQIVTSGATEFKNGGCSALRNGDKVKVEGVRQANGTVLATEVERKR